MGQVKYSILVHYSEIALKKNNRLYFENKFIDNISHHLHDLEYSKIRKISARVFVCNINPKKWDLYKKRLMNVMGLKNATLVLETSHDISLLKNCIDILIKGHDFKNFRISARRHYKKYQYTSQQLNNLLGDYVRESTNMKVDLTNPDLNLIIEVLKDKIYIGYNKIMGFSGLPANSQEKAFSLISSGIDSPVASFEMIKRGVELDFIHFHSYPAINRQSIDNVKYLIKILSQYQLKTNLYLVPLLSVQQKIMMDIQDKYWVIFFRRSMLKLSNDIALNNKGVALITGDSVGQVASQTLSNIRAISSISELPIIRPLSGMNKEDIVNKAKIIGTYNVSVKPYEDCCSHFVPAHPETKAKMFDIDRIDSNLDLKSEYIEVMDKIEKIKIQFKGEE